MARAATGPLPHTPHAEPTPAPAATGPVPVRERRRGTRQVLEVLGVLTDVQQPDKPLEVAVLNVSLSGCAFRAPVAFCPGATYQMRIGTGPLHLTSTLQIVSSRDRADGLFDVGAKFV